jgi:glyoxylase-like metal-dependent hydrolase (beta-lactamase superfamily II)
MIRTGEINSVDGVWITHYHDDHVDGIGRLVQRFGCPVMTDKNMAEIIEHPDRFFLPCISHASVNVKKKTEHGEKWRWREFDLTAYHFPGQTYYHSGLLAEGRGKRIFFAGDSFSPAVAAAVSTNVSI